MSSAQSFGLITLTGVQACWVGNVYCAVTKDSERQGTNRLHSLPIVDWALATIVVHLIVELCGIALER
jgi:hypothetical protein